jgi:glutathione reductase (NADPH)
LGERIFGGKKNIKMDYENVPTVIFSHPPLGVIGMGEEEAVKKYGVENIKVYKSSFNNMFFALDPDRSSREISLFKIICLKTQNEKILGIHANGRGIDEML